MNKHVQKSIIYFLTVLLLISGYIDVLPSSAYAAESKDVSTRTEAILPPGVTLSTEDYSEPVLDPPQIVKLEDQNVQDDVYTLSGLSKSGLSSKTESNKDELDQESDLPVPEVLRPALTSKQVGELMLAGAGPYDRYQLHLLAAIQSIDPLDIWQQKKKSGLTWAAWLPDSGLKIADKSTVSADVYGIFTEMNPDISIPIPQEWVSNQTIQQDTYSMSSLSTLTGNEQILKEAQDDLNNYRDLIQPSYMNQILNEQYADRQKTSESIDPATGALTWKFNALQYPGRDGLDMNLGIMYQSNQAHSFLEANAPIPVMVYESGSSQGYLKYKNIARSEWADENYLVNRFQLGNGWSFQIPSLQIEQSQGSADTYYYYHNGQGGSYEVDFKATTGLAGETHLVNPPQKNMRFMKDSGSYQHAGVSSAFYMEYPDKKREYFNDKGQLIGIVDRFGNRMTYEYSGDPLQQMIITDTAGRKLKVDYQRGDTENTTTVSSITPDGNEQAELVLKSQPQKWEATDRGDNFNEKNRYVQDVNPVLRTLSYVHDQSNGERQYLWNVTFDYQADSSTEFSYTNKESNTKKGIGRRAYFPLSSIQYPRSHTVYAYTRTEHNLGRDGLTMDYVVTRRADEAKKQDGSEGTNQVQVETYTYTGDYTGRPQAQSQTDIPNGYTYKQEALQMNGNQQTFRTLTRFNYKGQKQDWLRYGEDDQASMTTYEAYNDTFKYNPTKIKETIHDNGAQTTTYTENIYDDNGNLRQTTAPLTADQLSNTDTKQRYSTVYEYDPQYNQISSETVYQSNDKQLKTTYAYTSDGRLSSVTNPNEEQTTYAYAKAGDAVSQITVEHPVRPGVRSRTVTEYGAETGYTLPSKVSEYFRSASDGNELQNSKSYTYNLRNGLVTEETDSEGKKTTYTYDTLDRITSTQKPAITNSDGETYSITENVQYNEGFINRQDGNPVVAGLIVTTFQDAIQKSSGKLTTLNQHVTTYDGFGMTLTDSYSDRIGTDVTLKMIRYTTDAQLRPTKQTSAVYRQTAGSSQLQLLNGPVDDITMSYNSWGEVNETTDAQGNKTKMDHNVAEYRNYLTFSNAGGTVLNAVDQQYDQWGHLLETTAYKDAAGKGSPVKESYTYDIAGNMLTYTDPKQQRNNEGATQSVRYDALNRPVSLKDALNQTATYEYDGNDQLTKVSLQDTNNNNAVIYTKDYNESKLLLSKTDAANESTKNQYDALGRLQSSTDRNGSGTNYAYDEWGQLKNYTKTMTSPKAQTVKYTSTFGKGDIQTSQASLQTTNLPVINQQVKTDLLGRIIQQRAYTTSTDYVGAMNLTYNGWGQVSSMQTDFQAGTTPVKGTRQNYTYDSKQQLITINIGNSTKDIKYTYTPQGQVETITYPTMTNGKVLKSSYTYNALNQLSNMTTTLDSEVIASSHYEHDDNGNIVQAIEKRQGKNDDVIAYTYDALNRLIGVNQPSLGQATYTYDLRGNRLTLDETRGMKENLKETNYSYNALDQLDQYKSDGKTLDFRYLPNGTRYQKQVTATDSKGSSTKVTNKYVSNGSGKVIFESKGTDNSEYVRGDRVLLKKKPDSNTLYYYLYNGHGDVIGILYDNGTVANTYDYDEFGNMVAEQEKTYNPFKYAGEYQDAESGLYYLNARYYDPSMGRFINEDTVEGQISNPLTLNIYTYVENNPANYVDPSGNDSQKPNKDKPFGGGMSPAPKGKSNSSTAGGSPKSSNGDNSTSTNQNYGVSPSDLYDGGRSAEEYEALAKDPSKGFKIDDNSEEERNIVLDLEEKQILGWVIRDTNSNAGADFIDTTTGIKWDVKRFRSYPDGHTNKKKGAFNLENAMEKISKEFGRGYNVIIDTRNLTGDHVIQLRGAIGSSGKNNRVIWYPY